MATEIFLVETMGDALRNTGYKNIESAMSEIIDNSVQAEAKDVLVIVSEEYNSTTNRNNISQIAFLDNGDGMDYQTLEKCLEIGFSTRGDRKGMGRFGVGLPQSSMYACPRVEVYSWQGGYENCKMVFLDKNLIDAGEQKVIADPINKKIPKEYEKYLHYKVAGNGTSMNYEFTDHGTFVLWKNCDRVNPKTTSFLFKRLDFALGQKFRYFIHEDNCHIRLIQHQNLDFAYDIMPNDPLLLMSDNYVLGNPNAPGEIDPRNNKGCTETIFEPYGDEDHPDGVFLKIIKYSDPKTYETKESEITIKFSVVKDIFYDQTAMPGDPGRTRLGKHVKELEGISVVRANREIDFGQFDFYEDTNQPEHRWWGCEIRFNPELDEAFGVANNKQHVELHSLDANDYIDDEVKPVWLQLYSFIHNTIVAMYNKNKKTRNNSRSVKDVVNTPTSTIINSAEEKDGEEGGTSVEVKNSTPTDVLIEKNKEALAEQGVENPTEEEAINYMNNKVNITYANAGKMAGLFDYSFEFGNCHVVFNMDHIFYKTTLEDIFKSSDAKVAFELFVASLVKAVDETNLKQEEQNDNLIARWNEKLRRYINEQQSYAK